MKVKIKNALNPIRDRGAVRQPRQTPHAPEWHTLLDLKGLTLVKEAIKVDVDHFARQAVQHNVLAMAIAQAHDIAVGTAVP